jgi:hypothetical protein
MTIIYGSKAAEIMSHFVAAKPPKTASWQFCHHPGISTNCPDKIEWINFGCTLGRSSRKNQGRFLSIKIKNKAWMPDQVRHDNYLWQHSCRDN